MGQIENETAQDDLEGSVAPLGLSRSTPNTPKEGIWTPVLRKGLAITLGGLALAAVGALSMAHQSKPSTTLQHLTAAVPGMEPLEWLANNDSSTSHNPTTEAAQAPTAPVPDHSTISTRSPPAPSSSVHSKQEANQGSVLPDGRVVLNLATPTDLQTLPGIGQKRAESIIALRERLGGFKKLSDLLRVKGIGVKSLRKLEPKITLNPPASTTTPSTSATSNVPNSSKP